MKVDIRVKDKSGKKKIKPKEGTYEYGGSVYKIYYIISQGFIPRGGGGIENSDDRCVESRVKFEGKYGGTESLDQKLFYSILGETWGHFDVQKYNGRKETNKTYEIKNYETPTDILERGL